jgi:DNA-binding transcriptional MerR regulator
MATSKGRRYYKIGQVAKIIGVEPYVLRFWEREFAQIKTIRTKGGQRLYPAATVEILKKIKHLLYEEGLTIEGARKRLRDREKWLNVIEEIKRELKSIKEML